MKTETLPLLGKLDQAGALQLAQLISAIEGVRKVNIVTAEATVNVDFDDHLTSVQELRAVVQTAGYRSKAAHGEQGTCCGSCGG